MDPAAVERVKARLGAGQRIVVFLHPNIGDVVNLTAALRWLRDSWQPSLLVAVTSPLASEIARACPCVDEVWSRPESIGDRLKFWARLRAAQFDVSVHCQGQNTMLRLAARAGIPTRIGVYGSKHRILLDLGVEWAPDEVEQPGTMARLLGALGADVSDWTPTILIPEAAREVAAQVLGEGEWTAFMVGASHAAKVWPLDRFLNVRSSLAGKAVFIGGPSEARLLEDCDLQGAVNLAGKLSVLETAAVLERCRVLVTNDSGPMHLAAAVGTPVVAVFGPTSAVRFHPFGRGHVVLQGACGCASKDLDTCAGECLRSIPVADFLRSLSKVSSAP